MGLLGILAYQKGLEFTGKGAAAGKIPAVLSIWTVFFIFAAATIILFVRTADTTGVTPFNRFEDALSDFARAIGMRLLPKRRTAAA